MRRRTWPIVARATAVLLVQLPILPPPSLFLVVQERSYPPPAHTPFPKGQAAIRLGSQKALAGGAAAIQARLKKKKNFDE